MAGIDKIYGSNDQYDQLFEWCKKCDKKLLKRFYTRNDYWNSDYRPIANFRQNEDVWLWKQCNLKFVHNCLIEQYGKEGPKKDIYQFRMKGKRRPGMNCNTWRISTGMYKYIIPM